MSEQADEGLGPVTQVDYIGPFDLTKVVVNGRTVPYLQAFVQEGGKVELVLDDRFGLDLDLQTAERVVPFVAHCIAVASGWACFPDEGQEPLARNPFPKLIGLTWMSEEQTPESDTP